MNKKLSLYGLLALMVGGGVTIYFAALLAAGLKLRQFARK